MTLVNLPLSDNDGFLQHHKKYPMVEVHCRSFNIHTFMSHTKIHFSNIRPKMTPNSF